jgi:DNA polymerase V
VEKQYIAIDLKSFYASVECVERGLDPLTTHLVVADESRTEKTICLAVSPSLKAFGIPGRARLFEVVQKVKDVNKARQSKAPGHTLVGQSWDHNALMAHPELALSYIVAPPRMAHYIEYSTKIYQVYLKYVAPEDIHVYSIDEVFIDATLYLQTYHTTAHELALTMVRDVLTTTGITATAGIGTNLYLCKIAMDIVAKKMPADQDGVRIAELNERSYRELLWEHRPLTDFWRVGRGIASKLEAHGLYTMGDVAQMSLSDQGENMLYKLFGVNAELLIDHAWGWEPCTIADIKAYKPQSNSISSGQVLSCPYDFEKAKLVTREMTDLLVLDLVEKKLVTDQVVLTIGYDVENLRDARRARHYHGAVTTDHYGRSVPKHAHGTQNLAGPTSSTAKIEKAVMELFDRVVDKNLLVRRINVTAAHVVPEEDVPAEKAWVQLDIFTDYAALEEQQKKEKADLARERNRQEAILQIRKRFGKNAILRGMSLEEGATAIQRNGQIGGHKA